MVLGSFLGSLDSAARPAGLPILSSFGRCRVERGVPGASPTHPLLVTVIST
jgi:hypothetical protein